MDEAENEIMRPTHISLFQWQTKENERHTRQRFSYFSIRAAVSEESCYAIDIFWHGIALSLWNGFENHLIAHDSGECVNVQLS